MKLTIKSRKLGKEITFCRAGSYYIYVNLNGEHGCLGRQICEGGRLMGDTLGYHGESKERFEAICRHWFKAYICNHEAGRA